MPLQEETEAQRTHQAKSTNTRCNPDASHDSVARNCPCRADGDHSNATSRSTQTSDTMHASPASPASSLSSSAPLFQEEGYSSTSEEESKVTFTHGRCNGTSPNQHAEKTSTPTPSNYTTQGDSNASPSGSSRPHDITNEFLGTNNFFVPDGSNRWIHQIQNKVFHAGYLDNGNNAYLLELSALENMLNTRKFLMDEMSGQFYAVYGNSYQRMSTKPMLQ